MNSGGAKNTPPEQDTKAQNKELSVQFKAQHGLVIAFSTLILILHLIGIYLFCSGFLLSRLVLPNRSECAAPPVDLQSTAFTPGDRVKGCWYPKSFDKAVVVIVDALRYDFTVPFDGNATGQKEQHFHNAFPVLYETAFEEPEKAFLRPFIADPPTTTLQRLKGLTTGTLPVLVDAGSNFAGTAIDEDNLVEQLVHAGKKVVHLGDDTWHSLFPGYFEVDLTHAYDSFNVWDLHTVDNGVNGHIFPLLDRSSEGVWDVIFGHYLGVDHAGHRYGPDHPAMADKLRQMDGVIRSMIERIDDETLLVVMGDHGMDIKGDHGGESDDEVEAALWMYSKKGLFGRSEKAFAKPPATAKERPVGQIDLVPTLAMLLGLPIPFNNLGQPIEEAFIGKNGKDFANLAQVSRLTAGQIRNFQSEYAMARGLEESGSSPIVPLWNTAGGAWHRIQETSRPSLEQWKAAYNAFAAYQAENLRICRSIWARFDLASITMGIVVLIGCLAILAMYARGIGGDRAAVTPVLLGWGLVGTILGSGLGIVVGFVPSLADLQLSVFGAGLGGVFGICLGFWPAREVLRVPYPRTFWGSLSALTCVLLCIGFASNSFTIWEDEQLLFFLTTFGVLMLASSLGLSDTEDRNMGAINSLSFLVATRLSSFSRLCREEQMPNCKSTYYASATSSTSAAWQLIIPFAVGLVLPSVVRHYYHRTKNYQGSAVIWIGIALRIGLVLVALHWVLNAAADGEWYPRISESLLKSTSTGVAQVVIALSFAAGYATYIWASPLIAVINEPASTQVPTPAELGLPASKPMDPSDPTAPIFTPLPSSKPQQPRSKLLILGYANTHGSRYFLLPTIWLLALLLLQKPMGQGTLALCFISILNLLEVLDANNLRHSALGPCLLALMGSYYYFKTGHQATLASIQWESAFIPLKTIRYPWSPILVTLNTFGAQILCVIAVPAIPMWKVRPKAPGLLGRIAGVMATHVLFYAAIAVATVVEAAWLRRHLMVYRVFMPRMLMGVTVLLIVEVVGVLVAIGGARWSVVSVADIFGWV